MHDIYRSARRNLIYLGDQDGIIGPALDTVMTILDNASKNTDHFKTHFHYGASWHHHASIDTSLVVDVDPVLDLLANPWFSRLWVLQEACLARDNVCHCGSRTFILNDLLRAASWLWTKRTFIPLYKDTDEDFPRVRLIFARATIMLDIIDKELGWYSRAVREGWFRDKEDTSAMFALLGHSVSFETSEPVDHIFGLLGLWRYFSEHDSELPLLLQPDYTKDVNTAFRDATRYALQESESLALLQELHHRPGDEKVEGRPSWVPDRTRAFQPGLDPTPLHRGFVAHAQWMADKFDPAPDNPDSIQLEGIYVDSQDECRVDTVSYTNTNPAEDGLLWYSTAEEMVARHPRASQIGDVSLAIRTTLVAAENAERDVATDDDLEGYNDAKEIWQTGKSTLSDVELNQPGVSSKMKRASRYAVACGRMSRFRRFFVTTGGRIGLGPQSMQPGDFVVVLYGGEWPFVLRQVPNRDEYTMVGTALVYDIMKGEAVIKHIDAHGEDADELFTIV